MRLLYDFFIRLYRLGIGLAALRRPKARAWIEGRRDLFERLPAPTDHKKIIWVHAASAGEFEQAKPVIEGLKQAYPDCRVLATFFSPSGYEAGRRYAGADHLAYLPLDTPDNARRFLDRVQPVLVIFIKYDFWYHHLRETARRQVPLLLVSAVFRPGQAFFRPWGALHRRMLRCFIHLFVQDEASLQLLQKNGFTRSSLGGDTRFDRVAAIAAAAAEVPYIDTFAGSAPLLVAGSTWKDDERVLGQVLRKRDGIKLVLAPHEITAVHIRALERLIPHPFVPYSQLAAPVPARPLHPAEPPSGGSAPLLPGARTLLIDSTGLLARLYRYATLAYVGGGFTRDGIHNILEAAVWSKPVVFGPNYRKYREAHALIACGGAFTFSTEAELEGLLERLLGDESACAQAGAAARQFVIDNGGATRTLLQYIQANRLLTR